MFIPILGNERETREGGTEKRTRGGRRNAQGGDGETHIFRDAQTDGRTDGRTDGQTQVHIEVVPT